MITACIKCFRVLSVPTRFKIFEYLKRADQSVSIATLTKYTKLSQPTVTFHCNALAKVGLIKKTRAGKNIFCSIRRRHRECVIYREGVS